MNNSKNKLNSKKKPGFLSPCQLILLFSLFLLLFMGLTALFDTIHGSYSTISTNFYFYLQYFQQQKISVSVK